MLNLGKFFRPSIKTCYIGIVITLDVGYRHGQRDPGR